MDQFLAYICDRTGLLIDKGGGQLAFIHLSFQEYLAAWQFTCGDLDETAQREFFESRLGKAAWEEVLLLHLYVILHEPGGRGEPLFDSVVSCLLRKLEEQADAAGWLTLTRAVRDNLKFRPADRKTILAHARDFWLESPPRFGGDWFDVLEEVSLFAPDAKQELAGLLEEVWRHSRQLSRAVACLHLMQHLHMVDGKSRFDERPELADGTGDLLLELGPEEGWTSTLSFAFDGATDRYGFGVVERAVSRMQPLVDGAGQADPVWKTAGAFGACLETLAAGGTLVPAEITAFFVKCAMTAMEREIAVKDRQALALALGRLGDPRVTVDLRVRHPEEHPGYVMIPPGKYVCGDPKKTTTVDEPFWISRYPVTNAQFAMFIDGGGYTTREFWSDDGWAWRERETVAEPRYWRDSRWNGPNQPVVGVSWWEADAFCRWAGARLPTAHEWEAAARGPDGYEYPWGDAWEDGICNSSAAGVGATSAVGSFPRSRSQPFGLEDMAGNVWEWCSDPFGASVRVIRGGSWAIVAGGCRSAFRIRFEPQDRSNDLGFRVARSSAGQVQPRTSKQVSGAWSVG